MIRRTSPPLRSAMMMRAIHTVPIASMTFDPTSTLLATGRHTGVAHEAALHLLVLVQFHPDANLLQLFSSSGDCGIRMWDLRSSQCLCVLQSHFSAVTSLAFTPNGDTMVSSGRDKICTVWDLKTRTATRTVPVYEAVECVALLPEDQDLSQIGVQSDGLHFITAGSKAPGGEEGDGGEEEGDDPRGLTYLLPLDASRRLAAVTAEHNITLYQLPTLSTQQQFVGYNDEVLDVKFLGKHDSHIVVSTNSCQLKVFELLTNSCQILYGHTDTVLSLDVFRKGSLFASLKVWDLPDNIDTATGSVHVLSARVTEKAHDKDINSVAVSPNDKLLASGSQDRTAKLWSLGGGAGGGGPALLGVFRGHRRGVWAVCFSPADQVLASSSADGTAKLWSLQDYSCLKTFEGHDASVLKLIFVSRGTQLLTSGSDGLVKLWTIKSNECVKTLDAHQDKDVTEVEQAEEQAKQEDQILKQQELCNLLHEKRFLKALGLAISLDQPHTVLTVIKAIRQNQDTRDLLERTLLKLRLDQKESLLRYCAVWNTNARSCLDAQAVLQVLLTHVAPEELLQYQGARGHLEGLIPYTERHMQRMGRLLQSSMFLDYMWQKMRVTGAAAVSGMGPDENMDTSAVQDSQPLFGINQDPHGGSSGHAHHQDDEEEEEGGDVVDDEDEEPADEESITQKAPANGRRATNSASNGDEESSEEEDVDKEEEEEEDEEEEEQNVTAKTTRGVSLRPRVQILTS
ncbi:hypothetical protein CRUP_004460 [Coryphaenoides rupestris]|nr:hypothetical protein CRUP_004460 [Coryphaenoides rupestris]